MLKVSGIFLTVLSSLLFQLMLMLFLEFYYCDQQYEIDYGCDSTLRSVGLYFSIIGLVLMAGLVLYSDLFITKQFPDHNIPWSSWNEGSRLMRNLWKLILIIANQFVTVSYSFIINFICLILTVYMIYERYVKPSIYNRLVHVSMVFLESQLLVFNLVSTIVAMAGVNLIQESVIYIIIGGVFVGVLLLFSIENKEKEVVAVNTDMKNFKNLFQIELYVVVMLHELERLVLNEDYGQEKHIHAIISRHMEECLNEACQCKNYEPEYDKKFTSLAQSGSSKRLTLASVTMGGSLSHLNSATSLNEMKRLPYKVTYKTKVEIFKMEFESRVDSFLEAYPKSYGIKLLKSFFNHKYCDSSYKALFVQLENALTCKNFKGKIFIYHLKTQIQDEMNKSLESPLSVNINQLLRFEKYRLDFEKYLEDLSYNCQMFWTDLTKEEYDVHKTLDTAYDVSEKIIEIKSLFSRLVSINPLCIDTSSTYALAYRYILRDEGTFTELVNKIQQIKNSSKLEQQREQGVRFFDSDIYSLIMVTGDVKELGRVRQANSSCRFVFGYDPRDLIGSKINKLMPQPFSNIHDKFLHSFLNKGKSTFLERNQALPVITKDGFLQMTLFYVKPMVSLHFGLIFSTFAKILNKYRIADDSHEFMKIAKLCIFLTDQDGFIHGMSETASTQMGLPPPTAKKQLSINDNQLFNIQQISPQILQQEFEFELLKGGQLQVETTFLNKERQFRREYPDIACKIGVYQADVGVHKFSYRDLRTEISLYVIKIDEKTGVDEHYNHPLDDKSRSEVEELTYSEFSITTANSSVASSQVATSKFKTFKSKIQNMQQPSQVIRFQRISFLLFVLLLGIAAGNFAINMIQNHSYETDLQVLNDLQVLIQIVPEASLALRQLLLISNNLTSILPDPIIDQYYPDKYTFYSESLANASQTFQIIQNQMTTALSDKISLNSYSIIVDVVGTDGTVSNITQSISTSLNLYSSKILTFSGYTSVSISQIVVPHLSFQWRLLNSTSTKSLSTDQQDVYFVIQNGLGSIVQGLVEIQSNTVSQIDNSSQQAAVIAIVLAAVSIFMVIVLLPTSWPTLTHIEKISQLILMSLNRLPEGFCVNETKACMEIIMFLNEQKDGEKSTHQMIKKHQHRKQNRQLLKLPKKNMKYYDGSKSSEDSSSDELEKSTVGRSKKSYHQDETDSTVSKDSGTNTQSITSSKMTSLSKMKPQKSHYESQQLSQVQKVKRNNGGSIELELAQAKTSELVDDDPDQEITNHLTEQEIIQKERESSRKAQISKMFRRKKIKKFFQLIATALLIAIYFVITSYYLTLVHQYERMYKDQYQTLGDRIQCYSNLASYSIDSLARDGYISNSDSDDLASQYVTDCYQNEQQYLNLMIDAMTTQKSQSNFLVIEQQFEGDDICQTLALKENLDQNICESVLNGVLDEGLTEALFYFINNLQQLMIDFQETQKLPQVENQVAAIKGMLREDQTNQLISLHEVYIRRAFDYERSQSLQIIQDYFTQLNSYYNMLFGLFVGLISCFQLVILIYLVKKLSREIIKMYHVVLMVPFSGRTQNDLNKLMMIKL